MAIKSLQLFKYKKRFKGGMDMYVKQLFSFFVLILIVCNSVSSEIEKPSAPFGSPQRSFERMDLDKDGTISYDEYLSAYERRIKRQFNILDSNSDGVDMSLPARHFVYRLEG